VEDEEIMECISNYGCRPRFIFEELEKNETVERRK